MSRDWTDEQGLAAGAEALLFGVLIFVLGTLLFVNTWAVIDTKMATSTAAREGVRAAVETPHGGDPAEHAAAAAGAALAAHGLDPAHAVLEPSGTWTAGLERCGEVALTVRYHVPVVALPVIERRSVGFDVAGRHREIVDPYRSGLPLGGACDH